MTINIFLGNSVNFSFTNGIVLKHSSAFEAHAENFSHFSSPQQSPVSFINKINTLFKARIQDTLILDASVTPIKLRQFFTGQVTDLLNDIIDSENIDRSSLSVRLQGPNVAFLDTEMLNGIGLPITLSENPTDRAPTVLSKQMDRLNFESSLTAWVNDPNATGSKAEAEKRIRAAYEEMDKTGDEVELDLEGLALNSIPDAISHLTTLTTLDIGHNRLKALPVALDKCTSLVEIDAIHNPELCFFPVTLAFLPHFNYFFQHDTLLSDDITDYILNIQPFASFIGNSVIGFEMRTRGNTAAHLLEDYQKLSTLVLSHLTTYVAKIPQTKEEAYLKGLAQLFLFKNADLMENNLSDPKRDPLLLPACFLDRIPSIFVKLFEHLSNPAPAGRSRFSKIYGDFSTYIIERANYSSAYVNFGKKSHLIGLGSAKTVTLGLDLNNRSLAAIAKTSLDPDPSNAGIVAAAQNEVKILRLLPRSDKLLRPEAIYYRVNKKGIRKQYAFMPLCAGGPLTNAQNLPSSTKVRLAFNAAEGLRFLHQVGIAHQDIKPSNILLDDPYGSNAKLADFGVAADVGESPELAIQGTPPYMSPEKLRHHAEGKNYPSFLAIPEDIWALGKVFYELFFDPISYATLFSSVKPFDYNRLAKLFDDKYAHEANITAPAPWGFIRSMMSPNPLVRPSTFNLQAYKVNLEASTESTEPRNKRKLLPDDEVIVTAVANPRTVIMTKRLKAYNQYEPLKKQIVIGSDKYQVITSEFVRFSNHKLPLVSCGGNGRELLTFVPDQDPYITNYRNRFKHLALIHLESQSMSIFTPEELCNFVVDFVSNVLTSTEIKPVIDKYMAHPLTIYVDGDPCIPLGAFLKAQCGVCRHHALFTAYLLDDFIKNNPSLCSFQAILQIMRNDTKQGVAHAWVTLLTDKNQMFSIDTLHKICGDLSDPQFLQYLTELWGDQAINNQFHKVKHQQAGRKPVVSNNDDDGE